MARPLSELHDLMKSLEGVKDAYIQPPTEGMQYPCIMIERGGLNDVKFADNAKFRILKRYDVTVIDRAPDSVIPDLVENIQYTEFNRFFRANGLNHFVFQLYF